MAEKNLKARIIHKHDIEANWLLATGFTPKQGEIIVYDIDDTHSYERFKIGDGVQNVNDLPFAVDGFVSYTEQTLTDEQKAQARINIGAIGDTAVSEQISDAIENSVADWSQTDETAADYIKNRPFYERTTSNPLVIAEGPYTSETSDGIYFQWENIPRGFVAGELVTVILRDGIYGDEEVTITCVAEQDGDISYIPIEDNLRGKHIYGISCRPDTAANANGSVIYIAADFQYAKIILPNVIEEKNVIHHLDPKYIKDMYYTSDPVEVTLVDNLTSTTEEDWPACTFVVGDKYKVIWNDAEYECECFNDGEFRILGTPDNYPFYIDDDGGNSLYIESANEDEPWTVSIIHIAPQIKQIDNKYLSMITKSSDFVFGVELIDSNDFEGLEYRKLVGQYIVYVDDVSETVEFINNGDYSYAEFTSFEFVHSMETWNGGCFIGADLDGESHDITILEDKDVIKEEYLPTNLATMDDIEEAIEFINNNITILQNKINSAKDYIILKDMSDGKAYKIAMQNGNVVSSIAGLLEDFTYTENSDGTYTITGWNQTYLGKTSTEMIVPDSVII